MKTLCFSTVISATGLLLNLFIINTAMSKTTILDGYTDKFSYLPGDTMWIYANASQVDSFFEFTIIDISGKLVDKVEAQVWPQLPGNQNPGKLGFGYQPVFYYVVPHHLYSGIYLWENLIPFLVRSSEKRHDVVVLYESNTMAAYNNTGGKSLYAFNSPGGRGHIVSFNRPTGLGKISGFSKAFLKWLKSYHHCDIGYISDRDMDDYSEIENARLLVIVGHSEYWTRKARINFDRFSAEGKNILILSGNSMYWQVRYGNNKTQLICYKDSLLDPEPDPLLKTIHWSDSSLCYPVIGSIGGDFFHGGLGLDSSTTSTGWDGFKIVNSSLPYFKNTGIVNGDTLHCNTHEYDGCLISGYGLDSVPVLDTAALGFHSIDLVGFDHAIGKITGPGVGTWVDFQKTPTSGRIINIGSTNWCSDTGIGGKDSLRIRKISENLINYLMDDSMFLNPVSKFQICGNQTVCLGEIIALTARGGVSFLWSTGETTSRININPVVSGTYTVTVTDIAGVSDTVSTIVNVATNPLVPYVIKNFNLLTCSQSAYSYQWFFNGQPIPLSDTIVIHCSQSGYYKVRIANSSGCSSISNILYVNCPVGIEDETLKWNKYVVSPNPFSETIMISSQIQSPKVSFELFNVYNQLVKNISLKSTLTLLERGNLACGIYQYRIIENDKVISIGKLILVD